MQFCQNCGKQDWEYLSHGGCGGRGSLKACKSCKAVYQQTSGGLFSTRGGERFILMPYDLDEYRERERRKEEKAASPEPTSEQDPHGAEAPDPEFWAAYRRAAAFEAFHRHMAEEGYEVLVRKGDKLYKIVLN